MRKKKDANEDVGYCKPPKSTQFKPGRSGNPSGRPKGSKNAMTQLMDAANEKITVTVNGRVQRITKFQAICTQLMNSAVKADRHARKTVFDLMVRHDAKAAEMAQLLEERSPINIILSPEDMKL